ncbi:DsbA family protein [Patulibacter minatonensis]|uniref:DsbA family protein n=1 Tax=Patulibacter minatonensis TaxID=298163 RepID=UPI00047B41C1|nr:thioredoxin domain-containing protein [Patulibacter minatonensis]
MPAEAAAARRAREARESAEHAAEQRRRRLRLLGGAVGVVVVVVAVVVAVGAFRPDPAAKGTPDRDGVRGSRETAAMLRGLPQRGTVLGDPGAPVTLLEIADLKCPSCQAHELGPQREIVDRLVRTGKANLRLELVNYRDAPAGTTDGEGARRAAYALAPAGRFWTFVDALYWNQGSEQDAWATDDTLRRIATVNRIATNRVQTRETPASRSGIAAAEALARGLGTNETPSLYVLPRGSREGRRVATDDVDAIDRVVAEASRGG